MEKIIEQESLRISKFYGDNDIELLERIEKDLICLPVLFARGHRQETGLHFFQQGAQVQGAPDHGRDDKRGRGARQGR